MTGYLHPAYAQSLAEFGTPRLLPCSQGWILERGISESDQRDAMGIYPLFCCQHWSNIAADLADLAGQLVSLALVADPFGDFDEPALREWFDVVVPFKEHFLVELNKSPLANLSKHHRYYARRALQSVVVEPVAQPQDYLGEWVDLYNVLIARHGLSGLKAFSPESFAQQLSVSGLVMLRAESQGMPVGMHLWYVQRGVAYSHLMALSDAGYGLSASYALYHRAIEIFAEYGGEPVRWLNVGAGAGVGGSGDDGLSRFKRGWSNATRIAYFVGKILDRGRYDQLVADRNVGSTAYFPAYRQGEFA